MDLTEKILNEKDPILREIWSLGYIKVYEDYITNKLVLIGEDKINKVCLHQFRNLVCSLSFVRGVLPDESIHAWVKEADGSADRLRELLTSGSELTIKETV